MKTERLYVSQLTEMQRINSELNHEECESGRPAIKSYPRRVVFELTNRCNYQCIMCGRESADFQVSDLPFETITSFADFFTRCEEVTLHGWGEGTLHPRLNEILEYLNAFPRLRKYFVTNGSTILRHSESIFTHHVDLIAVSLDGSSPKVNDSIRKGGSFTRVVESVASLLEEKKKRNLSHPHVNLVFTAMRRNIDDIPEMVRLAKKLGIPELKVVYLTVFNPSLVDESLCGMQETVRSAFDAAKKAASELGVSLKLPEIQGEGEFGTMPHKPCAFPWRDFFIGSDGYVRPCQSSSEKLFRLSDYSSPFDAWNSEKMQSFRAAVNDDASMPQCCRKCYHSSSANWNLMSSFLQLGENFAPAWESSASKSLLRG